MLHEQRGRVPDLAATERDAADERLLDLFASKPTDDVLSHPDAGRVPLHAAQCILEGLAKEGLDAVRAIPENGEAGADHGDAAGHGDGERRGGHKRSDARPGTSTPSGSGPPMDPDEVLAHVDRTEYPWTPKRHVVDEQGHAMSYLDEGKGPPILFVHGSPTWSYLWRNFVKGLSGKARCIAPDQIGFGCSDKPREPAYHTLERHILNLTSLMRGLDTEPVTLVVQDWGGPIGLGWAVRHPQKVARIVLLNTWGMRPDGLLKLPLLFRLARSPGLGEIIIQKHNQYLERVLPMGVADKKRLTPKLMQAYRAPFPFPDDRVAILRFVRMVPERMGDESYDILGEIEAGLAKLDVPVKIVWARKDPAFGMRIAHRFADLLPQADPKDIVQLPDASHFLQEDAHEKIVPEIAGFIGR